MTAAVARADGLADDLADAQLKADTLEDEMAAVSENLTKEVARVGELESTIDALEDERSDLEDEAEEAEDAAAEAIAVAEEAMAAAEDAVAATNAMALRFDDEIRAAVATAQDDAIALACSEARSAARNEDRPPVAPLIAATVVDSLAGVDIELDLDPIRAELDRCTSEEVALIEAEQQQADLTADEGDGFYTVGDEIAPGLWRSTGTGDSCYWERYNDSQDILGNHFGNAGGSVRIRSTDAEVEFDDCGIWE